MAVQRIMKIHSSGDVITDEETPGTYVVPYVVDLACGCKKVTVELPFTDRDRIRGNEQDELRDNPRTAPCPKGHSRIKAAARPQDWALWMKVAAVVGATFLVMALLVKTLFPG